MNARLLALIAALAMVSAGMGCNKSGKLNTPSTSVPSNGPVELKRIWTPNERVVQEFDMKQKMLISLPRRPAPLEQNITMGQKYSLTVLNADADGGHEVEMELLGIRMMMDMGKMKMKYDSENDSMAAGASPIAQALGKMVGGKIQYFMDASNNVVRMEGVDELMDRLSTAGQAAAPLKSIFNESYFKLMMSGSRFLPLNPVQPGDTWPVQIQFPTDQLGAMDMNYTLTFKDWEMRGKRNCARIELTGTVQPGSSGKPNPMGMTMAIQDGSVNGVLWFDPELGTAIDGNMNQDMTILMILPDRRASPGVASPTQTITNQLSQVITFKADSLQ